jgi:hypothetical protein
MEQTKDPNAQDAQGESAGSRDAEATSSETLSDIEANEKVSTGGGGGSSESSGLEGSSPKPDSGGEGRADGSDSGGPM